MNETVLCGLESQTWRETMKGDPEERGYWGHTDRATHPWTTRGLPRTRPLVGTGRGASAGWPETTSSGWGLWCVSRCITMMKWWRLFAMLLLFGCRAESWVLKKIYPQSWTNTTSLSTHIHTSPHADIYTHTHTHTVRGDCRHSFIANYEEMEWKLASDIIRPDQAWVRFWHWEEFPTLGEMLLSGEQNEWQSGGY